MSKFFQASRNKSSKGIDIFGKKRNFNNSKVGKSERLLEGVGVWTSFYRSNPHRFVKDYIGLDLKLFQMILIYMMSISHYFMYFASRGQGKSWITAIYCCVRAILYPETKIIIASGTKGQARGVIETIDGFRKNSPNLAREISELSTSANDPKIEFHNGSWIKVVASNDNARSKRANLLISDEFRMIDLDIINKVLRKFLTAPRQPKYLNKPEYAHLQERNKEIYLSSAWYTFHWSWSKCKAFFQSMTNMRNYFVCGLPYQLAIKETLLMKDSVLDEMSEADFDETAFSIEMGCLFFGEAEKAFFKFEDLNKNRTLPYPIYPRNMYNLLTDKKFVYSMKQIGEIRLISCDIAAMGGTKGHNNDASVYTIMRLIPTGNDYERHIVYMESMVGGHTNTQALRIRQLFNDYECDYVVLDTQSMGLGVFDQLVQPLLDKERSIEYEPWSCINDDNMAIRCVYSNAPKIIYSIKGNASFNSECAILLRDAFKRRKIKLLINDLDAKQIIKNLGGLEKLSPEDQALFISPYIQTTAMINEAINLENEGLEGKVRLKESSGKRKDRYSSVTYGNYIAHHLEVSLRKVDEYDDDDELVYY